MEEGPQRSIALLSVVTLVIASAALALSMWGRQPLEAREALFGPPALRRDEAPPAAPQRLPAPDAHQAPQRLPPTEPAIARLPHLSPRFLSEGSAHDFSTRDHRMTRQDAASTLPESNIFRQSLVPPTFLPSAHFPEMTPDAQHAGTTLPVQPSRPTRLPALPIAGIGNDSIIISGIHLAAVGRNVAMEGVSRRTASLSRRAYHLADRGALYSARANFIQALQMITQALDAQAPALDAPHGTLRHGRALAAGLRAMKEADDFVPRGASLEADLDVPAIIAGHRTPILKQNSTEQLMAQLTPLAAMQHYFTYAQQQLTAAGGSQQAASMALQGLGKVQSAIAAGDRSRRAAAGAKAIVLQRAALAVDSRNYLAANELGVLLACYGQFGQARRALLHSVSLAPRATTWHNLAVVHQKLNEPDLAERAEYESQLAARPVDPSGAAGTSSADGIVQWVSPQAFAGNRPVETRTSSAPAEAKQGQRQATWWKSILIPWK